MAVSLSTCIVGYCLWLRLEIFVLITIGFIIFPLSNVPDYFKQDKQKMIKNNLNKLFPVILVIKHITRSSECWKQFLKDLIKLFDDNSDVIRLDFIDFPVNWKDLLKE